MASYGLIHPPSGDLHHCTHPFLHIRHANDAHRLFEAVRLKMLPLITKRLSPTERDLLASGQVFVWEEASTTATTASSSSSSHSAEDTTSTAAHTSGLERWTDGRRWSQSRMREPFLFYEEKVSTTPEEKHQKAVRRARKASSTSVSNSDPTSWPDVPPGPIRRQDRPTKPDGLTKQTYSSLVHVDGDPNSSPRKWHCVAYFSASDFSKLPTIDYYPALRSIAVPDGVYTSTKGLGRLVAGAAPNAVGNATIIRRRPGSVGVESAAGGNYSSLNSSSSTTSSSRQRAGSDWSTRYDDKIEEFAWQQPPPPPSSTSSVPPVHLAQPLQYHPRARVGGTAAHGRASISSSSGSTATDRSSPSTPPGYAMEEDVDDRDSLPALPPPSMYHHNHHHHHHHHQTTSLPSLPPVSSMLPPIKNVVLGSGWERSREDEAAIGAFRLQL